jgi:hypothetical protein
MSPILKQGLLKALYGAIGVFLAAFIPFLNANTAVLGSWTVGVIFVLTMVEEYFFPSSAPSTPSA